MPFRDGVGVSSSTIRGAHLRYSVFPSRTVIAMAWVASHVPRKTLFPEALTAYLNGIQM